MRIFKKQQRNKIQEQGTITTKTAMIMLVLVAVHILSGVATIGLFVAGTAGVDISEPAAMAGALFNAVSYICLYCLAAKYHILQRE